MSNYWGSFEDNHPDQKEEEDGEGGGGGVCVCVCVGGGGLYLDKY